MKEELKTFVKNLDIYMTFCGYNQTSLADKLGVSSQNVSKWARGICMPSMDNINKLCDIFHCTMSQLFQFEQTTESLNQAIVEENVMAYYSRLTPKGKEKLLEYLVDMNPKFYEDEQ